jgi:glycosyltransferase involved in cell wall biosynthesis
MKIWFPTIKVDSGSDVYVARMVRSLRQNGIDAEVTEFGSFYEFVPFLLRQKPVPEGTSIIHTNSWYAFPFAAHGLPLVVTVHHPVTDNALAAFKSPLQRAYYRLLVQRYENMSLRHASRIVCVSKFSANAVREIVPDKPVSTIYNFVDTDAFAGKVDYDFSRDRSLRLLFVGNLSRRKGYDLLQPIMKKLGKNFTLTIVSGLRQSQKTISAHNIRTLGPIDLPALTQLYRDSDVLLFPTRLEGFGYAPAEAMSSGLPVISSDNSSIPEVVVNGETGILCPTDDIDAFCDACHFFYNNPGKIREYGTAGRNRVLSLFSSEVITRQYTALYNELLI